VRCILAALVLLVAVPCMNRRAFRVKPRHIWCMAGCGIASITLFSALYFTTMQMTTVNIAVVLLYTSPLFVSLMSCVFFKERLTGRKLLALALVFAGCCLVSGIFRGDGGRLSSSVLLTGLGSGLAYALYSIFGRAAQNRGYTSDVITLWAFCFAAVAFLLLLDWKALSSAMTASRGLLIPCLAGMVVLSTLLPYCTYTASLQFIKPSVAAIIVAVEPIVGTLLGTFFFGEPLPPSAVIGMVLIVGSCFCCV
jgi:drug/metabolite transporter (DMT)-like permease